MPKNFKILNEEEDAIQVVTQPETPIHIDVVGVVREPKAIKAVKKSHCFTKVALLVVFLAIIVASSFILKAYLHTLNKESLQNINSKATQYNLQEVKLAFPPRNTQEGWFYNKENSPLTKLCSETKWKPNVYLHCSQITKGLTNVRAEIATCIRWAIDAGVGLIKPKISVRDPNQMAKFFKDKYLKPLSHFFDEDHLMYILQEQCPQMIIKENNEEIKNQIVSSQKHWGIPYPKGGFKDHVEGLLQQNNWNPTSNNETIVVYNTAALWGWDFYKEFAINQILHNTVQYNPNITKLADPLIAKMPSKYLAFHLRAETDQHWHTYEELADWFKNRYMTTYSEFTTVYVAVGNQEMEDTFRNATKAIGLNVVSKNSLAAGDEELKKKIAELEFDQQAIIDYEILKRSTYFFGVGQSSYSYGIAFQRGNNSIANCNCELIGELDSYFIANY